jgi:predicted Zn-dependent protease
MAIEAELPDKDGQIPEWLSTHPNHENRAAHLDELIPKAIQLRDECKCQRLPAKDPRDEMAMLRKMAKAPALPAPSAPA